MRKTVFAMLFYILCLLSLTLSFAESDVEAVNTLYARILDKNMPELPGEPAPYGRLLIAVYEDGNESEPRLSCEEMNGEDFHGISADRLASGYEDAQTVILIYPQQMSN